MHVLPYQHTHLADFVYLGDDAAHFTADNGQSILAAGVGQPQFKGMGTDLVETAVRHNVIGGGQCFQNGGDGALWQVQKIGDLRQAQTAGIGVDQLQIRSDSGNGVDQPQAVTVSVKAEALLYAAFAVLVALIYLVVQRRPAIR